MLKSRVTGIPDVNRMAKAFERPGIDPRCWNCVAYVTKFFIDAEGPLVDVVLVPDLVPETARVGADYAGPGFGLYTPIEVNTEVLVGFPNGDPSEGLVVTRRLWSKSDPPPQLAQDNPDDVLLLAKKGANIRIITQGANILIHDVNGEPVELALKSDTQEIVDALLNSPTAANDGGATYKAAITTALEEAQTPTGTKTLKAD